jgi:hypothetical protein
MERQHKALTLVAPIISVVIAIGLLLFQSKLANMVQ